MKQLTCLAILAVLAACTTTVTTFPDGKTIKTSTPAGIIASIVSGFTQGAVAVIESHNDKGFSK